MAAGARLLLQGCVVLHEDGIECGGTVPLLAQLAPVTCQLLHSCRPLVQLLLHQLEHLEGAAAQGLVLDLRSFGSRGSGALTVAMRLPRVHSTRSRINP